MRWAIDFDNTLMDPDDREPGYKMGRPYPGARTALQALRDTGDTIIIHTCRARAPQGHPDPNAELAHFFGSSQHVEDWLNFFEIPYDEVTALKPLADGYVDDKAIRFEGDWDAIRIELTTLRWLGTE